MANTDYPVNHAMAVKLWSKKLAREALKETYISRFMGETRDSLVYVKDETTKSAGDRIRVGLRMQLSGDGIAGDGTLEGNEEALTVYTDDLLIDQLRHAVRSGGEMSEQRVPFSVREEAMDGLRDWWADRMDAAFFNQIAGNTTQTDTKFTGQNATLAPTSAAGNTRIFYGGSTEAGEASLSPTTTASGTTSQEFSLTTIDNAVNQAKIAAPLVRPLRIEGQYKYVAFIHPNQTRKLRLNATANQVNWYDIMRARVQGGDLDSNPIFNGAIGEYNGVIMHESSRVPLAPGTTAVRRAVLCGAQAACFSTGRRDSGTQMKWVEELFDYENQLGVSAQMIWGMKKMVYNAIDFSTIVMSGWAPNPA
jgi:N4-gp56 family major capsid protein